MNIKEIIRNGIEIDIRVMISALVLVNIIISLMTLAAISNQAQQAKTSYDRGFNEGYAGGYCAGAYITNHPNTTPTELYQNCPITGQEG